MILNLSSIVEGHGEVSALPILLRRLWQELVPHLDLRVAAPIRISRKRLVKTNELEKALDFAARQVGRPQAVLVLIDADDDCPAELGPLLMARARQARSDVPTGVVLAKREFEAWFLAAIESLGGQRGLARELKVVSDPESIHDAKKALTRSMAGSRAYSPVGDQPALTAVFNMQLARQRSDSFDKCWREVERLFAQAVEQPGQEGPESG
jgi:hypothetical protein